MLFDSSTITKQPTVWQAVNIRNSRRCEMKKILVTLLSIFGIVATLFFASIPGTPAWTPQGIVDAYLAKGWRVTSKDIVTDQTFGKQYYGKCEVTLIVEVPVITFSAAPYTPIQAVADEIGIPVGQLLKFSPAVRNEGKQVILTLYLPPEFCNGLPAQNPIPVPIPDPKLAPPIVLGLAVLFGLLLGGFLLFPRLGQKIWI